MKSSRFKCDVGSSYPGAGEGPKGRSVRPLKWYVSWVQSVVRQLRSFLHFDLTSLNCLPTNVLIL